MRIAPSPVRLSKDGSETRDAGAHLNCLAPPPNLEFLRVLQTHFHPQLLRQNLGKQQKQRFPKVFQSISFLMMKRKFATKTKKKTNTAAAISQCSNKKPQKKECINRSPLLSLAFTPREQYTRHGISQTRKKKKIAHQISSQQVSLLQNKTARHLLTRRKIVFKNALKTKTDRKCKRKHNTSVYRKLLKPDHKSSKSKRNQISDKAQRCLALSLSSLSLNSWCVCSLCDSCKGIR